MKYLLVCVDNGSSRPILIYYRNTVDPHFKVLNLKLYKRQVWILQVTFRTLSNLENFAINQK